MMHWDFATVNLSSPSMRTPASVKSRASRCGCAPDCLKANDAAEINIQATTFYSSSFKQIDDRFYCLAFQVNIGTLLSLEARRGVRSRPPLPAFFFTGKDLSVSRVAEVGSKRRCSAVGSLV